MKLILSTLFLFTLNIIQAQEICDNGIDDDGDQAIDLQDSDCSCTNQEIGTFEEDFEAYTECNTTLSEYLYIDTEWLPAGTPQGAHECGFQGVPQFGFPLLPLPVPSGEGCVGMAADEGLVRCLPDCGLQSGKTYTFSFSAVPYVPSGTQEIDFVLYGRSSCSGIELGPVSVGWSYDWLENCSPNFPWTPLITYSATATETADQWESFSGSFTATQDYGAVLIAFGCNAPQWSYVDLISLSGDFNGSICDETPTLPQLVSAYSGDCLNGGSIEITSDSVLQYQWYRDGIALVGETDSILIIDPFLPGEYLARTISSSGICALSESFIIGPDDFESIDLSLDFTNPLCIGEESGSINSTNNSPNTPYTYLWSDGSQAANINNLVAGTYTLTVTDNKGCFGIQSVTLEDPELLTVDIIDTPPLCAEENSGSLEIVPNDSGGTYTYLWNNGSVNSTNSNIGAGNYSVTVTDENGCENVYDTSLADTDNLIADLINTAVACYNEANGSIELIPSNPTSALTFNWNTGSQAALLTDLPPGNYSVTVNNEDGCTETYSSVIEEAEVYFLTSNITQPSFTTGGNIELSPQGGTPPFQFEWSNGSTTPTQTNLAIGTIDVTVTDNNNCQTIASFELEDPLQDKDILDNIFIPNIFSPNNDGINDLFRIYTSAEGLISLIKTFKVFDRWGAQVYDSPELAFSEIQFWDGKTNSAPAKTGTYVYVIVLETYTGELLQFNGSINLVN